jgi:N-acetylneuraminate synthase
VRFDLPNPEFKLKPEMWANVELKTPLGRKLVVPEDAVMDSGTMQMVFVDRGQGHFESRHVQVGAKVQGYYEVLSGLREEDLEHSTFHECGASRGCTALHEERQVEPMEKMIQIGRRTVGESQPTYVVAEIGINHNGDLDVARRLIDAAAHAGVDAVKLQKRTPALCVPPDQKDLKRETPWGYITYLEYREKVEFGEHEFQAIDRHCREREVDWFASVWDEPSVDFLEAFDPVAYKIPSAALTDRSLLGYVRSKGRPMILSTGMSTMSEIERAVGILGAQDLLLMHATSTYPCEPEELNLQMIQTLRERFTCPVGYSGHEVGLIPTVVAVALGACLVERHITLADAMWGSDQAASVEPGGSSVSSSIRTTALVSAMGEEVSRKASGRRSKDFGGC